MVYRLHDLQSRALLCLSNIIGVIDEASFTQLGPLSSLWMELYKLASASQGKSLASVVCEVGERFCVSLLPACNSELVSHEN